MSKTILADVDGFTPCIDVLTQEFGIITAAVFGRVWRYCQGERGICNASLELIAADLNLNYRTVFRHVKLLVEKGYLEDLTPNLRNNPHSYRDTGKANLSIKVQAGRSEKETCSDLKSDHGMTQSHTRTDSESEPAMTQSQLKRGIKRGVKKEEEGADSRTQHPAIRAIREITGKNPNRNVYDALIAVLGEIPDIPRLKACFEAWCLKGYKPVNYGWVTDWYTNGIPAFQKPVSRGQARAAQPAVSQGAYTPEEIAAIRQNARKGT